MKSTILMIFTSATYHVHSFSTNLGAVHSTQQIAKVSFRPTALFAKVVPTSKATAIATGTVDAPIEKVWALFKKFDKLDTWWPIYNNFSSTGSDVGDHRTFAFKNRPNTVTTEELTFEGPSGDGYTMHYDLTEMKGAPIEIDSVSTIVTLTPNGDATDIDWRSWTKSAATNLIAGTQTKGYMDGIAHLQKYFNPAIGQVDVKIVSGKNLGKGYFLRPYADVVVDGADPLTVTSREWGSDPVFEAKPATFEIIKKGSKIRISVFDSNIGSDEIIGMAEVDIYEDLTAGESVTKELPLVGSEDATITVNLELTVLEGDNLPPSATQQELKNLESMGKAIGLLQKRAFDIQKYASMPEPPIWEYERKGGLPKSVKGLPASEVLPPHKIGNMIEAIAEYAFTQFDLKQRLLPVAGKYDRYAAYFASEGDKHVPCPDILKDNLWATDEEFLRQVFSGLNPMQVKVCTSMEGIPAKLTALKSKDGATVDQLMADGRLYLLDYPELRNLKLDFNGVTLYAPTLLIYRTGAEHLDILGIMLEPTREDAPVYTPNSRTPNKYLLAKIHVACADNQVHQFPYHLGYAHLGVEPMVIAAHNSLEAADHPLGSFLKPHFRGTVGINYLARQTLVADEGAITDTTFATGTAQGVGMTIEKFKKYNFMEIGLPYEMKSRGFDRADDFKGYRYRDDGWLIWDAIWLYCGDMVNALYDTDEEVANDSVLQTWAAESSSPEKADIQGFPSSFTEKSVLTKALTTIVWCTSALHSALNYDQYPYTATPINRAASLFGGVPDGPEDVTEEYILSVVPGAPDPMGLRLSIFQGLLSWLLATPEPPTLSQVGDRIPNKNNPLELIEFRSKYIDVYINFDRNLAKVEEIIDERNKGLKMPYTVLKPSKIAASINI